MSTDSTDSVLKDLVSIIIPTYNRYSLLIRAIQSVQQQTYSNIEIIVVNDCSTDQEYYSGEIEKLDKVIVIHLPENQRKVYNTTAAQGKTRQYGMNISKGEWIAFLDDDDYWAPTKLQHQLEMLEKYPECRMSSTNMTIVNLNNTVVRQYFSKGVIPKFITKECIQQTNIINNSSVLIHKNICNQIGEFQVGLIEDYDYWLKVLEHTICYYIEEPLVFYTMDTRHSKFYEYKKEWFR